MCLLAPSSILVNCPPGTCHTIISNKPLPLRFVNAQLADPGSLVIRHHGCHPAEAANIAHEGVKASLGIGAAELQDLWGFSCTGSYWTDDFGSAFKYPMEGFDSTGRPAGFLIAKDGTLPQRLIVTSVCIKSEYLYSLPGQEMYPIDCPHILSFTWLACDGSRLSTDQQEWCELLVDIEAQDLKEYLQFATPCNSTP